MQNRAQLIRQARRSSGTKYSDEHGKNYRKDRAHVNRRDLSLTDRQREVRALRLQGMTFKEIGELNGYCRQAAKVVEHEALNKLGFADIHEARRAWRSVR